MKMFINGEWVDRDSKIDVLNPFDGSVIDTVPRASAEDAKAAIGTAVNGSGIMAAMPAHERYRILHRASELMEERVQDLGRTISTEEGKVIAEGVGEAGRAVETMTLPA